MNRLNRYFDYNATTPLDPQVLNVIKENLHIFANPSSPHFLGYEAREKVERAREQVAHLIGASPNNIFFTSGGTEANNMVIKGWLHNFLGQPIHIITSAIEHPSVLEVFRYFERRGAVVTYVSVDSNGYINIDQLKNEIREETRLISVMFANNEIGTIQPIKEIAKIAKENNIFFHTDATQAVGKIPINVIGLEVDALSFSGHKFYGPKGIGVLYLKNPDKIEPLLHGGGQEKGIRSGTENFLAIVGLAKACEIADQEIYEQREHCRHLRQLFIELIREEIPYCSINGSEDQLRTLPNTINVCLSDVRGEAVATMLSEVYGIAVSTGSACSTGKKNLSHVLKAIGLTEEQIRSSIRISFGKFTTDVDIQDFVQCLKTTVFHLRNILPREIQGVK
jgi:cysteine desulfurase